MAGKLGGIANVLTKAFGIFVFIISVNHPYTWAINAFKKALMESHFQSNVLEGSSIGARAEEI